MNGKTTLSGNSIPACIDGLTLAGDVQVQTVAFAPPGLSAIWRLRRAFVRMGDGCPSPSLCGGPGA